MIKHFPLLTLLLCTLVLGFSACGDDDDTPNNPVIGSITDIIRNDAQFSTLAAALERTDLAIRLNQPTARYTLYAPTNDAFTAAGIDLASLSDTELRNILSYHVITGAVIRDGDIEDGRTQRNTFNLTAPGEDNAIPLTFDNDGSTIRLDNAANVSGDRILAVNGSVYPIDALLIPPTIVDRSVLDGRFSTLIAALQRTGLDDVLSDTGSYTVFAPTDDAFAASGLNLATFTDEQVRQLLLYHVIGQGIDAASIPGGQSFQTTLSTAGPDSSALSLLITNADPITINADATVLSTDVFASNGVIHPIDMVLEMQNVVDFVVKASALDSLQAAVTEAGLVNDLMMNGPFTVFAPVNAAFGAAADTIATFSSDTLTEVLLYHIVSGNIRSEDLEEGDLTTLSDDQTVNINIDQDADGNDLAPVLITPDSTRVNFITTDIQATNGVIHLIDGLLLPDLEN